MNTPRLRPTLLLGLAAVLCCARLVSRDQTVSPDRPPASAETSAPRIENPAFPTGSLGLPYAEPLRWTESSANVTWIVASGALPPGLHLEPEAERTILAGVPLLPGAFAFSLLAEDDAQNFDAREFLLRIEPTLAHDLVARASVTAAPTGRQGIATLADARRETSPAKTRGAADSGSVTIHALTSPTITQQPASQTVLVGEPATFSVTTSGTPPAFQWKKNGADVAGAVNHSLTIPSATAADAGSYSVVVTNGAGTETSSAATLTVEDLTPLDVFAKTVASDAFTGTTVRNGRSGAGVLNWFCSGPSADLTVVDEALVLSATGTQGRHAVAHFPATTVPVGATLTLAFDIALTAPATNGNLRFGLFNSNGGTLYTQDGDDNTRTYLGYAALGNIAPTGINPNQIRERLDETPASLLTSTSGFDSSLGAGGLAAPLQEGVTYRATLAIQRTKEDQAMVTVRYSGGDFVANVFAVHDVTIPTTFDTVALCLFGSGGITAAKAARIDNVSIVLTAPKIRDTFADGSISGGSLPTSAEWFCSNGASNLTVSAAPAMVINTGGTTSTHAVAHFPAKPLAVGDTLALDFDFVLTAPVANGIIRFGLFDSNGGPLFSTHTNLNVTYAGYAVFTNVAPTGANPTSLRRRTSASGTLITQSGSPSWYTSALASGGPASGSATLAAGTTYHARLRLSRTASAVNLEASFTGGTLDNYVVTGSDTTVLSSFDTLALCVYGSGGVAGAASMAISNVTVSAATVPVAASIVTPPASVTAKFGDTVNFSVGTSGFPAPTIQWKKDGVAISGATWPTYSLANVKSGNAATYSVTVTNSGGSQSASGTLSVDAAQTRVMLARDSFSDGERNTAAAPSSLAWRGSGATSTLTIDNYALLLSTGGDTARHAAVHFAPATLAVGDTLAADFDFQVSSPADVTDGFRFGLFSQNGGAALPDGSDPSVAYPGYAAFTNLVPSAASPASVRRRATTPSAVLLTGSSGAPYSIVGANGGPQATFATATTYRARLEIARTSSTDADITLTFTGGSLGTYTLTRTDAASLASFDTFAIALAGSGTIAASSVRIDNVAITHTTAPVAVSFTTQPTAQTVNTGTTVTLQAAATGVPAPTLQWYRNGVAISGATGASLALGAVDAQDNAEYTVIATNSSGAVTSNKALVTVNGPPIFALAPPAQSIRAHSTLFLGVEADGAPPVKYQWKKDGVDLPDATQPVLIVPDAQASTAGNYTVVATSGSFSTTSSAAAVTVTTPTTTYASTLAYYDAITGFLTYPTDAEQNRIPDFSHAGYKGGGVALPAVPVVSTLTPAAGGADNTAAIQAAIDAAGLLTETNGYRGTVLLAPGIYRIDGVLRLNKGGVVLAGSGNGLDPATSTILQRPLLASNDPNLLAPLLIVGGGTDGKFRGEIANTRAEITTAFVAVGTRSFDVDHPEYFTVGDSVMVWHPSTDAWLAAIDYGGTGEEPWRVGEKDLRYPRYITAISGSTITVDAPVFNRLDQSKSQSYLYKYSRSNYVKNLGLENFTVDVVTQGELAEKHAESCIEFVGAEDCWARRITTRRFWHYGIVLGGDCVRTTVDSCLAIEPHGTITGGRRYNLATYHAQLVLFRHCYSSEGRHSYINSGGNLDAGTVFLDSAADNTKSVIEPHAWWSTGTLFDNIVVQRPGYPRSLEFYDATGIADHGWCAAHGVAWRVDAGGSSYDIIVQKPPTAQNYAIGCFGNVTTDGVYNAPGGFIERTNQELAIRSLYRAQLGQRLGIPADGIRTITKLSDTFGDGLRYSSTRTVQWLSSHAASDVTVPAGAQAMRIGTAGATASRHAVTAFAPETLGIGDSLTLDFDFTISNPQASGIFRFGLFDSAGNYAANFPQDGSNGSVSYRGYAVFSNVDSSASSSPTALKRRTASGSLITQSTAYPSADTLATGAPASAVVFADGVEYHATLRLTVTGVDSATLTVTYSGPSLPAYTVSASFSGVVSTFDCLAICAYGASGSAGLDAITVDDVVIQRTTLP